MTSSKCLPVGVGVMVAVAAAMVTGCTTNDQGGDATTTSASAEPPTSTTRHVARGFHSDVADVYLPRGATLDPSSSSTLEMWEANEPYSSAVRDMTALLPLNQPLNGQPWCGTKTDSGSDNNATYWLWASPSGGFEVFVSEITGTTMIVLGPKKPAADPCSAF